MTSTPLRETVIRTAADLLPLWQRILGEGGFGRRTLWLVFLDRDGRVTPVIVPIDDVAPVPEPGMLRGLAALLARVIEDDDTEPASVVMCLSRPGSVGMSEGDRVWARALAPHSPHWPVHLATTDRIEVFAGDDLLDPVARTTAG